MGEEIERETFECDVCFVGAGPACLAGAIQLHKQFEMHNEAHFDDPDFQPIEPRIIVIEKGSEVGSHGVSGAVLDPKALQDSSQTGRSGRTSQSSAGLKRSKCWS